MALPFRPARILHRRQRLMLQTARALGLLAGCLATASMAQAPNDPVREFVHRSLPASSSGVRVEVAVGQLDPRLRLAPCNRVEPYLLPGTRLWGRTSVGVKCIDGAQWSVSLPVTVSVFGTAVVAAEPLAAGSSAALAPVRVEEAELSRDPGTPLTDPAQLEGRSLIRPIPAGQVIRMEHLRVQPSVAAGDPVRIEMMGRGFVVQAEGQALVAGGEGQPIRARTENGRIVAGTLRGRTVEVRL
jgi:flagella basal body P-ring formation protein FlgA